MLMQATLPVAAPDFFAEFNFATLAIVSHQADRYMAGRKSDIPVQVERVEGYFDDKVSGQRLCVEVAVTCERKGGKSRPHPRHKHVELKITRCVGYSAEENRWGTEDYSSSRWSALVGGGYEHECPVTYAEAFAFALRLIEAAESDHFRPYARNSAAFRTFYRRG